MKHDFIEEMCRLIHKNNFISTELYDELDVKRGLRNKNGTGVLVGLTKIGSVIGYSVADGKKIPEEGRLYYRGYLLTDIIRDFDKNDAYCFERTMFLLLFGKKPTEFELKMFNSTLKEYRNLPDEFIENFILRQPSNDIMNQLQREVLCLYSIDKDPDNISLENLIDQTLSLIAKFPALLVYSYHAVNYKHYHDSLIIHHPKAEYSTAENILHMLRSDSVFTPSEARILDLILTIHAEHGGGNNSAFTSHVVSSTGTDTYSTISAAIGSLKGPMHGGANSRVTEMIEDIKSHTMYQDRAQLKDYLIKIFDGQAFDRSGKVYGMGHAVYTLSDPRATILKEQAKALAEEKGMQDEFILFDNIENLTREIARERKGESFILPTNVDLYSGLVYRMLEIPENIFTPLFALSRIASWNAHRIEQLTSEKKIIRPAYKAIGADGKLIV